MSLLDFFSSKDADEFAKSLARDIAKRYPPSMDASKEKKISVNRMTKILEDVYAKAVDYNQQKKLGWFKKAKLGNTFRWELTERGYSKEFVETATEGLVVYLTRKTQSATANPK